MGKKNTGKRELENIVQPLGRPAQAGALARPHHRPFEQERVLGHSGDQFRIRGFDSKDDVYLDGLRDFAAYTRDACNYEEIQVLKGPSGLMFGRGTTGGAINTVSKTPF